METAVRISGVALRMDRSICRTPAGMHGLQLFPVRDVVVIKLDANGVEKWVRTIDGGQDDAGEDMAEAGERGVSSSGRTARAGDVRISTGDTSLTRTER